MFHADRMKIIYLGDCRHMTEIPDNSVHCVVSSPPYWGLRRYEGNQDLVWGSDNHCEHEWGNMIPSAGYRSSDTNPGALQSVATQDRNNHLSQFCSKCSAWRGALGLEPTPELYLLHLIEILREVRKKLRPEGTVWWNIGDSYAGSWGNYGARDGQQRQQNVSKFERPAYDAFTSRPPTSLKQGSIKPLDLCLIPQRLAIMCQQDGWWVRSIVIWNKQNPMPESVNGVRWEKHRVKIGKSKIPVPSLKDPSEYTTGSLMFSKTPDYMPEWQDCPGCPKCSPTGGYVLRRGSWRPTESHEYILMLTKTDKYYADMEAVREPYTEPLNRWGGPEFRNSSHKYIDLGGHDGEQRFGASAMFREGRPVRAIETGRNLRSVWEFPTEGFGQEMCKACGIVFSPKRFRRLKAVSANHRCHCSKGNNDYAPDWVDTLIDDIEEGKQCLVCGEVYTLEDFESLPKAKMRVCACGAIDWLSHFAVFPEKLPEICIKASTPEMGVCAKCGAPWARIIENKPMKISRTNWGDNAGNRTASSGTMLEPNETRTIGWKATCSCNTIKPPVPATVLDPFMGSGTTLFVAQKLGRKSIGYDLSEQYCNLAFDRLRQVGMELTWG